MDEPVNPLFKSRLGRGLNSLIGGGAGDQSGPVPSGQPGEFQHVDVEAIARNPWQPRKDFDAESLNELIESVVQHGVLQPLIVRKLDSGFQLIAGERRWIAAKKAGLRAVPCRVVELVDQQVCEVAIIENLQRTDLNDLEKAAAFQQYLEKFQCTIEDLARKLGKDRSTVSNALRLLELPDFVKLSLQSGKITAGHARALLPLDSESEQIAMCQRIQSEHLNVRQVEEAVREKTQPSDTVSFEEAASKPGRKAHRISNHVKSLQEQLRELLGCKVEIQMKSKDAGKVIVHFGSNDDFERIVGHLRKAS